MHAQPMYAAPHAPPALTPLHAQLHDGKARLLAHFLRARATAASASHLITGSNSCEAISCGRSVQEAHLNCLSRVTTP